MLLSVLTFTPTNFNNDEGGFDLQKVKDKMHKNHSKITMPHKLLVVGS